MMNKFLKENNISFDLQARIRKYLIYIENEEDSD